MPIQVDYGPSSMSYGTAIAGASQANSAAERLSSLMQLYNQLEQQKRTQSFESAESEKQKAHEAQQAELARAYETEQAKLAREFEANQAALNRAYDWQKTYEQLPTKYISIGEGKMKPYKTEEELKKLRLMYSGI